MNVGRLIGQVQRYGYSIAYHNGQPSLRKEKPNAELPNEILEELKKRREEIIEWFTQSMNPPEMDNPSAATLQLTQQEPAEPAKQEEPEKTKEPVQTRWPIYGPEHQKGWDEIEEWNRKVMERARNGSGVPKTNGDTRSGRKRSVSGNTQKNELTGMG